MSKIKVRGGVCLCGDISVGGSKNAALPILFATLLARDKSEIYSLPEIADVAVTLDILRSLGATVTRRAECTVINTENIRYATPSPSLTSRIRASTYLIGAMLTAFGRCEATCFGGCAFSDRPIDLHIGAAVAFGAEADSRGLSLKGARPVCHTVGKHSVGATVNSLLLAAGTEGESCLLGCAREPHIDALIEFLISMGADISSVGDTVRIRGGTLHGGKIKIPPDTIEAATYLIASALTEGRVRVCGIDERDLLPLNSLGLPPVLDGRGFTVGGIPDVPISITTEPYPGFPTDIAPLAAPLLALGGGGRITETVWRERFGYLSELAHLGVSYAQGDGYADIFPSRLRGAETTARDLRGGAACLIAALAASGESVIDSVEIINRGYENPVWKLSSLGADIEIIK